MARSNTFLARSISAGDSILFIIYWQYSCQICIAEKHQQINEDIKDEDIKDTQGV